jgi:glycolate oxidase
MDGTIPRRELPRVLSESEALSKEYGLPVVNVFHAGDGNLHPCLLFDERQPGALETIREAGAEVLEVCVAAGGALTGEHGVGLEKKEQMPLVYSEEDMAVMRRVRDAFAPGNRINPGKIFPDGTRHTPAAHRPAPGMPA